MYNHQKEEALCANVHQKRYYTLDQNSSLLPLPTVDKTKDEPLNNQTLPAFSTTIDVYLIQQPAQDRDLIQNVEVFLTMDNNLFLYHLLEKLKNEGFPLHHAMIFYLNPTNGTFVYCGNDPLNKNYLIPGPKSTDTNRQLTIKFRPNTSAKSHINNLSDVFRTNGLPLLESHSINEQMMPFPQRMASPLFSGIYEDMNNSKPYERSPYNREFVKEEHNNIPLISNPGILNQNNVYGSNTPVNNNQSNSAVELPKRIKERRISEVLEKVSKWRKLYQGGTDDDGNFSQMPLDIAAQRVGISKKTLDDYLLQIRLGKKYGFDFSKYYNEKIGVLRAYVRKHRQNEGPQERIYQRYEADFIDSLEEMSKKPGKTPKAQLYNSSAAFSPEEEDCHKYFNEDTDNEIKSNFIIGENHYGGFITRKEQEGF